MSDSYFEWNDIIEDGDDVKFSQLLPNAVFSQHWTLFDGVVAIICRGENKIKLLNVVFQQKDVIGHLNEFLKYSVECRSLEMIEYFINRGAYDFDGALYMATKYADIKLMEYFIEKGAKDLNSSLMVACEKYDIDKVKYLVENGATAYNNAVKTCVLTCIGTIHTIEPDIIHGALFMMITLHYGNDNEHINKIIEYLKEKGANNWNEVIGYINKIRFPRLYALIELYINEK